MNKPDRSQSQSAPAVSRRDFLKHSTLVTAGALTAVEFPAVLHAQSTLPIRAAVVGLGGRGSGAAGNFLEAVQRTGVDGKIVAVADLYPIQARHGADRLHVPLDHCFSGFDAYLKAMHLPEVNYVIVATPPGFRPAFFRACIEAGKNLFMEKPVAVDGVGCQMNYATYEMAKQKNLKVAAGTQRRHQASYIATIQRILDGEIGDVVTLRAYWVNGNPIWWYGNGKSHYGQTVGDDDLSRQINNWYHYIWLCGDHICEQHVHNLDVCNWIMGTHPVSCWGQGARQQLGNKSGEIWDNFAIEYTYPNGVQMFSYCGQIRRKWTSVSEFVHGTNGTSDPHHIISSNRGKRLFQFRGHEINPYVQEHMDLIHAIVNDTELNEAKNVTDSTLTAIMGREAAYSGAGVTAEQVLGCKFRYGSDLVYEDPSKLDWGAFRTLQPPMPSMHDIFSDPPMVPTV